MAKELLNGAILDMGLALFLSGPSQVRTVAKRWKKRVTTSNRRILITLMNMNDDDLWDALTQAIDDFLAKVAAERKELEDWEKEVRRTSMEYDGAIILTSSDYNIPIYA